jgi:hypothetical protein
VPHALRLHRSPLLTTWASSRDRPRVVLQPSGGYLQHCLQQHWRHRPPGTQHTFFILSQAVIALCSRLRQQRPAKVHQWLYDLVREVVGIHVAFPDPPLLASSAGLFL